MRLAAVNPALAFSCLGHFYAHLYEPIFYIVALVLPSAFGMDYAEVLTLIIASKVLYGVLAPIAGWLGDRWGTLPMMVVYFLGLGLSGVLVAFVSGPWGLAVALTFMGIFGAIYHPVGIAWLVRNAKGVGQAMGINGVFGSFGPAIASLLAGVLMATFGWQYAFALPGLVILLSGIALFWVVYTGRMVEVKRDPVPRPEPSRATIWRVGILISVSMLCTGLVFQALSASIPKLMDQRMTNPALSVEDAAFLVAAIYGVAGLAQVVSGYMNDRVCVARFYAWVCTLQVPTLLLIAIATDWPIAVLATVAVLLNTAGQPGENLLTAIYSPSRWRGTALGLKFILSFGISAAAVPLVSLMYGINNEFTGLYWVLAGFAAVAAVCGWLLPPTPADHKAATTNTPKPIPGSA